MFNKTVTSYIGFTISQRNFWAQSIFTFKSLNTNMRIVEKENVSSYVIYEENLERMHGITYAPKPI